MKLELAQNETVEDLQFKNLKIIQNKKGFCFGIDSILLSDFAKKRYKSFRFRDRNRYYSNFIMWKNGIKRDDRSRNSKGSIRNG